MNGWPRAVADLQTAWADAFERRDVPALAALYTVDAALYGSRAELYRGREGASAYFAALPPRFRRARFGVPAVVVLGPGAAAASGPVTFETEENGAVCRLRYRMTHVVTRVDGACLIATHHASPEP